MTDYIYDIGSLEKDLVKFFKTLPPSYRERAIGQIYQRALITMRDAIRANIPASDAPREFVRRGVRYRYNPGNLRKSISIKYLPPRGKYQYPAAKVYVKRGIQDGWYAHFLERGTADRTNQRAGRGNGASRGSIKPIWFFRRGVDATMGNVESYVSEALKKHGERVMEQQLNRMGLRSKKIKMTMR